MEMFLYLGSIILVIIAQSKVQGAYRKYKQINSSKGYTGAQVARKILDINGLYDVVVEVSSRGTLSDHYDPKAKTVRLSNEVYNNSSIASISIAAHECGHAIQHATNYGFIVIRNIMLPSVMLASQLSWGVIFAGIIFKNNLLVVGIVLLIVVLVFQIVTLPIEFNASSRALKILSNENFVSQQEETDVKKMLNAAAFTYVAGVISSAMQILRLVMIANRDD